MAVRCGVDIIEIERIRRSLEELGSFRDRVFTGHEISWCESRNRARYESYAARFAAKEAVLKALGTGWRTASNGRTSRSGTMKRENPKWSWPEEHLRSTGPWGHDPSI